MDERLKELLMQRATPTAPTGLPAPPPTKAEGTASPVDRYKTSLAMQNAYANGWQPNPTLIRILGGMK